MQNSGEDGRPYQVDTMSFLSIDSYTMLAFVRDVYANLAILCTVSIIQMLVVSLFKTKFSDVLPVPPFLWLVFAYAVLTLLNCTPRLRYKAPYNWVLAFITVECVTLFTLYFLFLEDWYVMMGCGVLAVLIVTLFTYWGSKGPKGCMPTAAVATVIVATALVGMFLFLVLSVLLNNLFILGLIFVLFILLVTVTIVQSELIHARMNYFPMGDQVGSAVTIFLCGWGVHSCFIFAIVVIKRAFDDQYKMHTISFAT
ncbi:uncharacterized protein [Drosophila bipectinata]|uniref:uncharacterized protein n=1 Tax=Drosophila bipectinata TaxID=42026 RepID=UPI001C8ACCEE|nr:uncharacterized protein LOC108126704 [Drosophila bipectinata]